MGILYKKKGKHQMFQKSNVIPEERFLTPEELAMQNNLKYSDEVPFSPDMLDANYAKEKHFYSNEDVTVDNRNWVEKKADKNVAWGESPSPIIDAVSITSPILGRVMSVLNSAGTHGTKLFGDFSKVVTGNGVTTAPRGALNKSVENATSKNRTDAAKNIATETALAYAGDGIIKYASPYFTKALPAGPKNMVKQVAKTPGGHEMNLRLHNKPTSEVSATVDDAFNMANSWSSKWYRHPEFKKRMYNLQGDVKDDIASAVMVQEPKYRAAVRKLIDKEIKASGGSTFEDVIQRRINRGMYKSTPATKLEGEAMGAGVAGHSKHMSTNSGNPKNLVKTESYIGSIKPNGTQNVYHKGIKSTGIHEGGHGITFGNVMLPKKWKLALEDMIDKSKMTDAFSKYAGKDTEIYARVQQIREHFKIQPGQQLHGNQVQFIIDQIKAGNTPLMPEFANIIKSSASMKNTMNTVPVVGAIGTGIKLADDNNK